THVLHDYAARPGLSYEIPLGPDVPCSGRSSAHKAQNTLSLHGARVYISDQTPTHSADDALAGRRKAGPIYPLTVNRLRPFARRRFKTKRPPRVLMRSRNPWVRRRRKLCG